jgi:hypothetical protein
LAEDTYRVHVFDGLANAGYERVAEGRRGRRILIGVNIPSAADVNVNFPLVFGVFCGGRGWTQAGSGAGYSVKRTRLGGKRRREGGMVLEIGADVQALCD